MPRKSSTNKEWPYKVVARIETVSFSEVLKWLHEQGHVLRETMKFGDHQHKTGDTFLDQDVLFKDKDQAMLFKLVWG